MKYSRSAITQLTKWYRQVLIKCAILNAAVMVVSFGTPALASEISGFDQTSGTYNIEAAKVSGNTGFRQYEKFKLDNGDIANLLYKDSYNKFVNLVDNQVNINGIVNTMKDNNFFNGHAIFVSPNGIVVGASGVLNVGS
ncbi:MAG: leukotoxin LktA family filamentous adhesin, partial [Alphaproteobacteria bacterium]|nr:leukotoxin LktA family filamentous adhesin [Alphaproteobacteria bacterium]